MDFTFLTDKEINKYVGKFFTRVKSLVKKIFTKDKVEIIEEAEDNILNDSVSLLGSYKYVSDLKNAEERLEFYDKIFKNLIKSINQNNPADLKNTWIALNVNHFNPTYSHKKDVLSLGARPYNAKNQLYLTMYANSQFGSSIWMTKERMERLGGTFKKDMPQQIINIGPHKLVNLNQIENINLNFNPEEMRIIKSLDNLQENLDIDSRLNNIVKVANVEFFREKELVANNTNASYSPLLDGINMPNRKLFTSKIAYSSIFFHEFAHCINERKRLTDAYVASGRKTTKKYKDNQAGYKNKDGLEYKRAEIVAELSSYLLIQHLHPNPNNQELKEFQNEQSNRLNYLQNVTKGINKEVGIGIMAEVLDTVSQVVEYINLEEDYQKLEKLKLSDEKSKVEIEIYSNILADYFKGKNIIDSDYQKYVEAHNTYQKEYFSNIFLDNTTIIKNANNTEEDVYKHSLNIANQATNVLLKGTNPENYGVDFSTFSDYFKNNAKSTDEKHLVFNAFNMIAHGLLKPIGKNEFTNDDTIGINSDVFNKLWTKVSSPESINKFIIPAYREIYQYEKMNEFEKLQFNAWEKHLQNAPKTTNQTVKLSSLKKFNSYKKSIKTIDNFEHKKERVLY